MRTCNIAEHLAPKDWKSFKKWHGLACNTDLLTAEERWVKMGNKVDGKDKPTKKEVK